MKLMSKDVKRLETGPKTGAMTLNISHIETIGNTVGLQRCTFEEDT